MTAKKTTNPVVTPLKTVTVRGVEMTLDPAAFINDEIVLYLSELDDFDTQTDEERKQTLADMYRVFRILFPNWRDIAKKLRDDTGRVPRGAITSFILETIAALSPNS